MSLSTIIIILSSISIVLLGILLSFHLGVVEWVKRAAPYYQKKPKRHDVALIWTISCLFVLNITGVTYASLWHGKNFYSRYDGIIFCDIFSRVQAFASIGVMCGVTAVLRNLHELIRFQGPSLSRIPGKHAWKGYLVDLSICSAFPIIQNPLLYLVQARRYVIVENIGCSMLLSDSWLSLLLYYIWFAIWALIAAVYAILTMRLFFSRDDDLDNVFVIIEIGITKRYFIKILIFCIVVILGELPVSLYLFALRCKSVTVEPYSFAAIHSNFNVVNFVRYQPNSFIDRWLWSGFAFVAFMTLGTSREPRMVYMHVLDKLRMGWIIRDGKKRLKKLFKGNKKNITYIRDNTNNGKNIVKPNRSTEKYEPQVYIEDVSGPPSSTPDSSKYGSSNNGDDASPFDRMSTLNGNEFSYTFYASNSPADSQSLTFPVSNKAVSENDITKKTWSPVNNEFENMPQSPPKQQNWYRRPPATQCYEKDYLTANDWDIFHQIQQEKK